MSVARVERWILVLACLSLALVQAGSMAAPPAPARSPAPAGRPVSALADSLPGWAPSRGLLVAEVVTRGAAASDQYVEIYNASVGALSLAGLELVYVTASGATVTRKQAWSDLWLPAGHHLLIANAAGAFAANADGLFSGGFSTTGGSLVLRSLSGGVVDALSWGTAANAFVERSAGLAPPTGAGLERLPGGQAGNAVDTNDNLADTHVQQQPVPRNLAAGPLPAWPGPTASASPSPPAGLPSLSPTDSPAPTYEPPPPFEDEPPGDDPDGPLDPSTAPGSSQSPGPPPQPTADPGQPTAAPTAAASPAPADPTPTLPPAASQAPASSPPEPTPSVEPSPSPAPPRIADLRSLPLGTPVTAHGWLTTPLGLTESGRGAFIEDETGGLAVYLGAGTWPVASAVGTTITISGVLETRFSLLTLRVASADHASLGQQLLPPMPMTVVVNEVAEGIEGRLVSVEGAISDGISTLTDGFSTSVDDGTGSLRVIVAAASGIDRAELARGRQVRLTGVIGQRDTSGTGLSGYRLHLRGPLDIQPMASPSPEPLPSTPPATPGPTLGPPANPSPVPTPVPTPMPTAAQPSPIPIALARQLPAGQRALVQGVVTVRPGRVLGDRTICLQDSSAGICVRLPDGVSAVAGDVLIVDGTLADPYGNLELRPAANGVTRVGSAALPPARNLSMSELGEATEGLLALVKGTLTTSSASSTGAITVMLEDATGEGRVYVHAPLGMTRDQFPRGRRLSVYGIVGDRLGLYRLWPRDAGDFVTEASPPAAPTPTPTGLPAPIATSPPGGGGQPGPTPSVAGSVSIGEALRRVGQKVTVDGVVSAPAGLLDADGRRLTIQDGSGAILLRLPIGAASAAVGQRLRATGEVGTYYGAPQLAAVEAPVVLGGATLEAARVTRAPLPASAEWRLVVVSGNVDSLSRSGDAWRAELAVDGGTIPIVGLGRSGIPTDALVKGRLATVTGVVRRAYPTATDQRLAIVPRSRADVSLGAAQAEPHASGGPDGGASPDASPTAGTGEGTNPQASGPPGFGDVPVVALSELAAHEGRRVRVGGRIERLAGEQVLISDGTAVAALVLVDEARSLVLRFRRGLLINASGQVVRLDQGGLAVRVGSPSDVVIGGAERPTLSSSPAPSLATMSPGDRPDEAMPGPTAAGDGMAALVGLLVVMGAVTGSATAFLAAQPGRRRAIRLVVARFREAIWRWRTTLRKRS
jgi:hypothetical protein